MRQAGERGSARRESYRYAPASRMRNTFITEGAARREEMISSMEQGVWAKKRGGGSVSPGTGDFNFATQEAWWVEGGKPRHRVRGATWIGNGVEILQKIDRVGSELALKNGTCGSVSGQIPVTVGQPPLVVREITVGGRHE